MYLCKPKPKTPGSRHKIFLKTFYNQNSLNKFFKNFKKCKSGRNNQGIITVRHKSSTIFNRLFHYNIQNKYCMIPGVISKVLVNKNKHFGLIKYFNGSYTLIKLAAGTFYGSIICNYTFIKQKLQKVFNGSSSLVKFLRVLTLFFNLIFLKKNYGQYAKSAGTFCQLIDFNEKKKLYLIELPTKKRLWISGNCSCIIGRNSNIRVKKIITGKAGLNRLQGIRPTVRGVAMNPVDHPHGGRTKTNKPEVTPWGKIAKFNK